MADLWIVLVSDRHTDLDALPFSTEEGAVSAARRMVADNACDMDDICETPLTPAMLADGWVLDLSYSPEGDSVRVLARQVDARG